MSGLLIPRMPKDIEKILKEEYPNSTKAERQKKWDDLIKKLYVEVWQQIDERKKLRKKAFPLKRNGWF